MYALVQDWCVPFFENILWINTVLILYFVMIYHIVVYLSPSMLSLPFAEL